MFEYETKVYWLGRTWEWATDDRIFIFRWTIPLMALSNALANTQNSFSNASKHTLSICKVTAWQASTTPSCHHESKFSMDKLLRKCKNLVNAAIITRCTNSFHFKNSVLAHTSIREAPRSGSFEWRLRRERKITALFATFPQALVLFDDVNKARGDTRSVFL